MLYDPKWTKPAAVVWSLDRLIAWLETMPAGEQYCYTASGECLLAQYLKGIGWAKILWSIRLRPKTWRVRSSSKSRRRSMKSPEGVGGRPAAAPTPSAPH
jgi:hypothetical protein